jgi:hypothetical protein
MALYVVEAVGEACIADVVAIKAGRVVLFVFLTSVKRSLLPIDRIWHSQIDR